MHRSGSARGRVSRALNLETDLSRSNSVPSTIFGGGAWAVYHANESFATIFESSEKFAKIYLNARRKHCSDIAFLSSGCNNILASALGAGIKFRKAFPPEISEHLSIEEIETIDAASLVEDKRIKIIHNAYKIAKEYAEKEDFTLALTCWGPFTLAAQLVGIEKILLMIKKDTSSAEKVLKLSQEAIIAFYEQLAESSYLEIASIAEANATGDLISANDFRNFSLKYLREIIRKLHKHGSKALLHVCGDSNDRIELMLASNADCISIDYKTSLKEAIKKAGKKACVAGNMHARILLSDRENIKKHAISCFEDAREAWLESKNEKSGYILMPGCDAPLKAGEDKLRAFTRALNER